MLPALFIPKQQRLSRLRSRFDLKHIDKNSVITNLRLSYHIWNDFHQILKNSSMLKYLDIHHVDDQCYTKRASICIDKYDTVHLKQLTMTNVPGDFLHIKALLLQTPNLKRLTISASHWKHLITTSLLYLNTFKFEFSSSYKDDNNTIIEKLKEFQNEF